MSPVVSGTLIDLILCKNDHTVQIIDLCPIPVSHNTFKELGEYISYLSSWQSCSCQLLSALEPHLRGFYVPTPSVCPIHPLNPWNFLYPVSLTKEFHGFPVYCLECHSFFPLNLVPTSCCICSKFCVGIQHNLSIL